MAIYTLTTIIKVELTVPFPMGFIFVFNMGLIFTSVKQENTQT